MKSRTDAFGGEQVSKVEEHTPKWTQKYLIMAPSNEEDAVMITYHPLLLIGFPHQLISMQNACWT